MKLTRSIEYLSMPTKTKYIYDVLNEQTFNVDVKARMVEDKTLQLVLTEANAGKKVVLSENPWNNKALEPEDIVLQSYLVPTVNTSLIKCRYFLEVSFAHSGLGVSEEIPKIVFPIYLFAPEIKEDFHRTEAPLNYSPKIFHLVDVKVPF
jgi:hypothetical protein